MLYRIYDWLLNNLDLVISIILIIIALVLDIVSSYQKGKLKVKNDIFRVIPQIMEDAEILFASVPKSGEEKLEYVLSRLEIICSQENIECDTVVFKRFIESVLNAPTKYKEAVKDGENVKKEDEQKTL